MRTTITTHNNYVDLETLDQPTNQVAEEERTKENTPILEKHAEPGKDTPQTPGIDLSLPKTHEPLNVNTFVAKAQLSKNMGTSGIESMLPIPQFPHNSILVGSAEVIGGLDGKSKEKHTNLQEGVSKWRI